MSNFIKNKIEELLQKPNDATFEPDNEFFESLKDDTKGEETNWEQNPIMTLNYLKK